MQAFQLWKPVTSSTKQTSGTAASICNTHFLWYSVLLEEVFYVTSFVKLSLRKVCGPTEERRGETERINIKNKFRK